MTKRKPLKLRSGYVKKLMSDCRVSKATVIRSLKWDSDTDLQNLVRKRAIELGYIKRF